MIFRILFLITCLCVPLFGYTQTIPSHKVLTTKEIKKHLKSDISFFEKKPSINVSTLASYFRQIFDERYFYNCKRFKERFEIYSSLYPEREVFHRNRALDHLSKFKADTPWLLPFEYIKGGRVNAYALRHLARQHKMLDIAFLANYDENTSSNIRYFVDQMASLNQALSKRQYERIKDGNGVYESFRSGYRVLNWLQIHQMFLSSKHYTDDAQVQTVLTLLQHASHLYKTNQQFHSGNHQTRGMSALAMLSILFHDFKDADLWFSHSMKILEEHLDKEINADGFQFERTVHYHMSDIDNYFYVYQLAKLNKVPIKNSWSLKLKSLFDTLVKIAYPDKSAPVLSDDTEIPWAEKNDISKILTLGYLLYGDPVFGYFAKEQLGPKMFWYVSQKQLESLNKIKKSKPAYGSLSFENTGYFIMREGWGKSDKMMIISNGLDDKKPDHQHGDMLGVSVMSNERVVLPNYQVRYSLKDYGFFKNSIVKNVALVDNELQGKKYKSNKGGSGFGKFKELPNPKTLYWDPNENLDVYIGSHDGFKNSDVNYQRKIIFVDQDFWIVKDSFKGSTKHQFKQVWQGHFTIDKNMDGLLRSTFDNGSGFDIYQFNYVNGITQSGTQGKQWSIVKSDSLNNFEFLTLLYPYKIFNKRIILDDNPIQFSTWQEWSLDRYQSFKMSGLHCKAIFSGNRNYVFSINRITINKSQFSFEKPVDLYLEFQENKVFIKSLEEQSLKLVINSQSGEPKEFMVTHEGIGIDLD